MRSYTVPFRRFCHDSLVRVWHLPLILIVLGAGCAGAKIPGASPGLLSFLRTGTTTRQEVLLTLGQPSASFEQERILAYRVGQDPEQGYYLVAANLVQPWQRARYSLVLVFDASGVLEKQSLIPVQ